MALWEIEALVEKTEGFAEIKLSQNKMELGSLIFVYYSMPENVPVPW